MPQHFVISCTCENVEATGDKPVTIAWQMTYVCASTLATQWQSGRAVPTDRSHPRCLKKTCFLPRPHGTIAVQHSGHRLGERLSTAKLREEQAMALVEPAGLALDSAL